MATPEQHGNGPRPTPALRVPLDEILRSMREREALVQKQLAELYDRWGPGSGCHRIACVVCGTLVYRRWPGARYCSYRCRAQAYVARRKLRREQARRKQCAHCGNAFIASRNDAKFCSSSCRQASYRARLCQNCQNR